MWPASLSSAQPLTPPPPPPGGTAPPAHLHGRLQPPLRFTARGGRSGARALRFRQLLLQVQELALGGLGVRQALPQLIHG
jgi:hypothetical protein